jgi:hypothetical protein
MAAGRDLRGAGLLAGAALGELEHVIERGGVGDAADHAAVGAELESAASSTR